MRPSVKEDLTNAWIWALVMDLAIVFVALWAASFSQASRAGVKFYLAVALIWILVTTLALVVLTLVISSDGRRNKVKFGR